MLARYTNRFSVQCAGIYAAESYYNIVNWTMYEFSFGNTIIFPECSPQPGALKPLRQKSVAWINYGFVQKEIFADWHGLEWLLLRNLIHVTNCGLPGLWDSQWKKPGVPFARSTWWWPSHPCLTSRSQFLWATGPGSCRIYTLHKKHVHLYTVSGTLRKWQRHHKLKTQLMDKTRLYILVGFGD